MHSQLKYRYELVTKVILGINKSSKRRCEKTKKRKEGRKMKIKYSDVKKNKTNKKPLQFMHNTLQCKPTKAESEVKQSSRVRGSTRVRGQAAGGWGRQRGSSPGDQANEAVLLATQTTHIRVILRRKLPTSPRVRSKPFLLYFS